MIYFIEKNLTIANLLCFSMFFVFSLVEEAEAMPNNLAVSSSVSKMSLKNAYNQYVGTDQQIAINSINDSSKPPVYDEFIFRMEKFGRKLGERLKVNKKFKRNMRLDLIFYDAQKVFIEIGQFTGETEPWNTYANKARDIYIEDYLVPNKYKVAGWMRFPHGLYLDWKINANKSSRQSLITLRQNGMAATPEVTNATYVNKWKGQAYSRPIAYAIENNILAERAGEPRNTERLKILVNMALGHIEQWTTGVYLDKPKWHFVQAFMTGLTASALIEYYEFSVALGKPDNRIPVALKKLADWLWTNMWVHDVGGTSGRWNDKGGTGYGAFRYVVPTTAKVGSDQPAPMVSQLISPSYAWLYKHTCDVSYKDKADQIFSGGVMLSKNLSRGKFFNQQHRDVFNYLRWRNEGKKNCGNKYPESISKVNQVSIK